MLRTWRRRTARTAPQAQLEVCQLEGRVVPTVHRWTLPISGALLTYDDEAQAVTITGTARNETLVVRPSRDGLRLEILSGVWSPPRGQRVVDRNIPLSPELQLEIAGRAGMDQVSSYLNPGQYATQLLRGEDGNDTVFAKSPATLQGGAGNDYLGQGDPALIGGAAGWLMEGGAGQDSFSLQGGVTAFGGEGDHTFIFYRTTPDILALGEDGTDSFVFMAGRPGDELTYEEFLARTPDFDPDTERSVGYRYDGSIIWWVGRRP